jgi:DNA repair photolyase
MTQHVHKGRGALSRRPGRFAATSVEFDLPDENESLAPATVLQPMQARSIISSNDSPDIPFDRSINPYLGCEHGCIYCYARPSHSYLDLSPGLDFETRIFYKPNAVERLLAEWQKPAYDCRPITIGANTDPYQPAEKKLGITRGLLEACLRHRHPVSVITKGTLLRRDLDLLAELASMHLCAVAVSVPTLDSRLKRIMEPRVPAAARRLELMAKLAAAGVPVTLLLAPVIPAVNDGEIETIVQRAGDAGASRAGWILLRLPHELKEMFSEWLDCHFPDRARHVMSLLRQASGGKDYDARFGIRQRGRGPYAGMIAQRFEAAAKRAGLDTEPMARSNSLDCSQFVPPGQQQLSLAL